MPDGASGATLPGCFLLRQQMRRALFFPKNGRTTVAPFSEGFEGSLQNYNIFAFPGVAR
jgi:hypothetical protein